MGRVHAVFFDLQPVALPDCRRAGDLAVAGQVVGVEDRKIGLLVGRAHIGEHQPVVLAHRVGAMAQPVLERAVGGLTRGFEDRAVGAEQPAVVAAANALLIDQPEFERGAAMRAMQFQQPDRAALVAKGDQVFPQDPQPPRDFSQFGGLDDGLPEASQDIHRTGYRGRPGSAPRLPAGARDGDRRHRRGLEMVLVPTLAALRRFRRGDLGLGESPGSRPAPSRRRAVTMRQR